jgi:hypothetical protein
MDNSEVDALQRMIQKHFRTHIRALAADPLQEELYRRQLETMTEVQREYLSARVAYVARKLTGG